jgi:hypothetical protein
MKLVPSANFLFCICLWLASGGEAAPGMEIALEWGGGKDTATLEVLRSLEWFRTIALWFPLGG